ncbi:HlyD family efflux transporter periplasmic adaptor subunit [Myroides sp. BIT-d1]|uniref:HlyD family efflux transporter periplasmic adaptor subunit n=2 Tax=Flavobacteriaceae TaxID=49546 RepID=A0A6I3LMW0_9FLAO|nr:HlyD family efflux transporter periplasmic adaptor subunit [Myroides albus]MVX36443.1 HlyD family efflux transporter periplasmic adaptor subunit [Myroides sp. LoEW2-1]
MDRALPRKNRKKVKVIAIVVAILLLTFATYKTFFQNIALNVERKEVRIRAVEEGFFEDYISFQGQVEPLHSMLINIVEGGAIQELFIENGAFVKQGDPLVRLYNPSTEYNFMSQENALIEQMNNLNVSKMNIRNQEINLTKDLISVQHDYKEAELMYELNKKLYDQEVLSKSDWERTKESFRYQQERKALIEESISKEKQTSAVQLTQIEQSMVVMQKSLVKLRENKENFLLTAPISGRLSSFDVILGKTYAAGESIGKIDVMKGYKLVAQVDEFYLERIQVGQKGQIDMKGQLLGVEVKKIIPEVKKGRFEVQLEFLTDKELKLQEGSTFGVKLFLSGKEKRLLLAKGNFYQETLGEWVYVVKNNRAERRKIEIGRENPAYYEIVSGLQPGEEVIISSYKDYLRVEYLNIKN